MFTLGFACAGAKPPFALDVPPPENAADRWMARLETQFVDTTFRLEPVRGSELGYVKWDALYPDWTPDGVARALATYRSFGDQLARFPKSKLSVSYEIDHDLLVDRIEERTFWYGELRPFEWDVPLWLETISGGLHHLALRRTPAGEKPLHLEALVARVAAIPAFLEVAKRTLKSPPRIHTEAAIRISLTTIDVVENRIEPLVAAHAALAGRLAIEKPKAVAALREFHAFLENDLLARSTGDFRLGRERWEKKVRLTLTSSATAEEILRGAESALDAARFEMYDVALPLFREKWPNDRAYASMSGDPRIDYVVGRVLESAAPEANAAPTIEDVAAAVARAKRFVVDSGMITLPPSAETLAIERAPAYLDGLAPAIYAPSPPFARQPDDKLYVSAAESGAGQRWVLEAIAVREVYPGHFVQRAIARASKHVSAAKRAFESPAMAEGWPLLAEDLAIELGFAREDPRRRLSMLRARTRMLTNAILDVRVHTTNASEAELDRAALELLTKKSFDTDDDAAHRIRRAKLTSAQLVAHYAGYRELARVERSARKKNKQLELRAFVDKLLSFGIVPPRTLHRVLNAQGIVE